MENQHLEYATVAAIRFSVIGELIKRNLPTTKLVVNAAVDHIAAGGGDVVAWVDELEKYYFVGKMKENHDYVFNIVINWYTQNINFDRNHPRTAMREVDAIVKKITDNYPVGLEYRVVVSLADKLRT